MRVFDETQALSWVGGEIVVSLLNGKVCRQENSVLDGSVDLPVKERWVEFAPLPFIPILFARGIRVRA